MDAIARFESRIRSLEASRRRSRLSAWALGLVCVLVSAAAMMPQTAQGPQEAQAVENLTAQRITLTDEADQPSVVLLAGPGSSLVIQTEDGEEIARIGGLAARHTR